VGAGKEDWEGEEGRKRKRKMVMRLEY